MKLEVNVSIKCIVMWYDIQLCKKMRTKVGMDVLYTIQASGTRTHTHDFTIDYHYRLILQQNNKTICTITLSQYTLMF